MRIKIALVVFLAIAGYFLVTEHRAHLALGIPYLPYILLGVVLLACPLMHLFMHHGHGDHETDSRHDHH